MTNMIKPEQAHLLDSGLMSKNVTRLDNLLTKCSELEENMQKIWEDATTQGIDRIEKLRNIKKVADKTLITMKYTEEYKHMRKNVKKLIHKRYLQKEAHDKAIESLIEQAIAPSTSQVNSKVLFSFESFKKIPEFKLLNKHKRKFGESWLNKNKGVNISTIHENNCSLNSEFAKFDSPQPVPTSKQDLDNSYTIRLNLDKKPKSPISLNKSFQFRDSKIFRTPNRNSSISYSINSSLYKQSPSSRNPLRYASVSDMSIDLHQVEKFKLPSIHIVRESQKMIVDDSMIMELLEETFDNQDKLRVEKLIGASHINEQKRKGLGRIPAKSVSSKANNY